MKDQHDQSTDDLLAEPKKRGRPATGKALSNADRQRAYRERQKAQRNENRKGGIAWEDAKALMAKIDELTTELEKALERAKIAEAKLAQRNGKSEKTWTLQGRTGTGKWQNLAAGLDEKEASRQLDRVIDAKISGESKRQYRLVQD